MNYKLFSVLCLHVFHVPVQDRFSTGQNQWLIQNFPKGDVNRTKFGSHDIEKNGVDKIRQCE